MNYLMPESLVFSHPKILFHVSLFVDIPTQFQNLYTVIGAGSLRLGRA